MRLMWFLPLAYLAGIDGFGWFVPYLLLVGAVAALLARKRAAQGRVARTISPLADDLLELEPAAA